MESQALSPASFALEGTSQIFVDTPSSRSDTFKEILVDQSRDARPEPAPRGENLQAAGKRQPRQSENENRLSDKTPTEEPRARNEDLPIFVDPPASVDETYPVASLYDETSGLEVYSLTDEDLAEPVLVEVPGVATTVTETQAASAAEPVLVEASAVASAETQVTPATEPVLVEAPAVAETQAVPAAEAEEAELTGLAALAAGNYAEPIIDDTPARVEVAALTTRPFTRPIEPAVNPAVENAGDSADEAIMPATSSVTANAAPLPSQTQAATVPDTGSGLVEAAVREAIGKGDEVQETTAGVDADDPLQKVVPASSSVTLSAERLAELRQIQAYAENMTARANDGSNGGAPDQIDIAAMSARLDRASAPAHAGQPLASQTAPQPLNITEKGWEKAFGQNIHWMSANNIKSAQIRISPAELGPVQIDLTMHKDQLSLQINATHQITRDTLEAALPRLRSELSEQGFANADIGMSDQGRDQHGGQQAQDGDSPLIDEPLAPLEESSDAGEVVPATSAINLMSGTVSLLDTFA